MKKSAATRLTKTARKATWKMTLAVAPPNEMARQTEIEFTEGKLRCLRITNSNGSKVLNVGKTYTVLTLLTQLRDALSQLP